jgi:hypothetical protein
MFIYILHCVIPLFLVRDYILTLYSSVLEILAVKQPVKKFPTFMKATDSLPSLQQPGNEQYPESDEHSSHY